MTLRDKYRALLGAFSQEQGILPSGYKLCEYLESTGTQYIDLKSIPTIDTYVEQVFEFTKFPTGTYSWYGSMPTNLITPRWNFGITSNRFYIGFNSTIQMVQVSYGKHTIAMNRQYGWIDGTRFNNNPSPLTLPTLNNYLYARHRTTGADTVSDLRIFSHKEYDYYGGNLTMDLLPCLDNNNRPCMYDTVSKQTFYNQGTGEFLYGPIIN